MGGRNYFRGALKDSVFSVNDIHSRCYLDGRPINHDLCSSVCTQENTPVRVENNGFYYFTKEAFLKFGTRICGDNGERHLKGTEAIDIDTEDDWQMAQAWAAHISNKGESDE